MLILIYDESHHVQQEPIWKKWHFCNKKNMETSYIRKEIDYKHAMEMYTLGTILLLLCKKL